MTGKFLSNLFIRQKVAAGASGNYEQKFHADGIMEDFSLRFYQGQQLDLTIDARIKKLGGSYVPVFNNFDDSLSLLAGDDDYFNEKVGIPVRRGESLQLIVVNNSVVPEGGDANDYIYDFQCHASIREG